MTLNLKKSFHSETSALLRSQNYGILYEKHQDVNNRSIQNMYQSNPYSNNYFSPMMISPTKLLLNSHSVLLPVSNSLQNDKATIITQSFAQNLNFCVRFAVNGISKFTKGNIVPLNNRNIQAGDFGDDAGMIAENSKCIVIGNFFNY